MEGFAYIKVTGVLALVPALMILEVFQGDLQYVLVIFPNFWAIKGLMVKLIEGGGGMSYPLYLLAGAAYNLALAALAYRFFLKRAQY